MLPPIQIHNTSHPLSNMLLFCYSFSYNFPNCFAKLLRIFENWISFESYHIYLQKFCFVFIFIRFSLEAITDSDRNNQNNSKTTTAIATPSTKTKLESFNVNFQNKQKQYEKRNESLFKWFRTIEEGQAKQLFPTCFYSKLRETATTTTSTGINQRYSPKLIDNR